MRRSTPKTTFTRLDVIALMSIVLAVLLQVGCQQTTGQTTGASLTPIGPLGGPGQATAGSAASILPPIMSSARVPPPSPTNSASSAYSSGIAPTQSSFGVAPTAGNIAGPAPDMFGGSISDGAIGSGLAPQSGVRPVNYDAPLGNSGGQNVATAGGRRFGPTPRQETASNLRLNGLPLNDLTNAPPPPGYFGTINQTMPGQPMPAQNYRTPNITAQGTFAAQNQYAPAQTPSQQYGTPQFGPGQQYAAGQQNPTAVAGATQLAPIRITDASGAPTAFQSTPYPAGRPQNSADTFATQQPPGGQSSGFQSSSATDRQMTTAGDSSTAQTGGSGDAPRLRWRRPAARF